MLALLIRKGGNISIDSQSNNVNQFYNNKGCKKLYQGDAKRSR